MNFLRWRKIKLGIDAGLAIAPPAAFEFYLTDICNLRCRHCNIWSKAITKPMLPFEIIRDLFRQAWRLGVRSVGYTGGEPTLHRDFRRVIQLGHALGFRQHVTTNAIGMSKSLAEEMARSCRTVGVSVDGVGPVFEEIRRTKWSLVDRGLRILIDAGADVSLGLVVTAKNIDNVREVMAYADSFGIPLGLQPYNKGGVVMPDGLMLSDADLALRPEQGVLLDSLLSENMSRDQDHEAYYRELFGYAMHDQKRTNCYISFDKFVVEANGDVRPCHVFPVVGNIQSESLEAIWYSARYNAMRREMVGCKACYLGCYEHINIDVNRRLGIIEGS